MLDDAALAAARPDIILTQELCAVCAPSYAAVSEVARTIEGEVRVVSLEPRSIEGILNTIMTVGALLEAEDAAIEVVAELRESLGIIETTIVERRDAGIAPVRVVALEWLDPPFATGHWIPEQVRRAGGWDLLGREGERSVETTWESIRDVDPEMLVLMPCGYDVGTTMRQWKEVGRPAFYRDLEAVHRGQVFAVDGSAYFSRPGPRVIEGIALLAEIFDPDAFVDRSPIGSWSPVD